MTIECQLICEPSVRIYNINNGQSTLQVDALDPFVTYSFRFQCQNQDSPTFESYGITHYLKLLGIQVDDTELKIQDENKVRTLFNGLQKSYEYMQLLSQHQIIDPKMKSPSIMELKRKLQSKEEEKDKFAKTKKEYEIMDQIVNLCSDYVNECQQCLEHFTKSEFNDIYEVPEMPVQVTDRILTEIEEIKSEEVNIELQIKELDSERARLQERIRIIEIEQKQNKENLENLREKELELNERNVVEQTLSRSWIKLNELKDSHLRKVEEEVNSTKTENESNLKEGQMMLRTTLNSWINKTQETIKAKQKIYTRKQEELEDIINSMMGDPKEIDDLTTKLENLKADIDTQTGLLTNRQILLLHIPGGEPEPEISFDTLPPTKGYIEVIEVTKSFVPNKSCRSYVKDMAESFLKTNVPNIYEIIEACSGFVENNKEDLTLSTNMKFALALFSYNIPTNNSSQNFYYQMNRFLRTRINEMTILWRPYLYFLFEAFYKLEKVNGILYRGMPREGSGDVLSKYNDGDTVHWSAFTSLTSNERVAADFAGKGGIIFRVKCRNGRSINKYSMYPTEDEILVSPNSKFIVYEEAHTEELISSFGKMEFSVIGLIEVENKSSIVF
eukprot:NODE_525_length_2637_cov_27.056881_g449_i0.p1 GENE.NODE_525_length_2637_cov_27.056881_g449_i0~~NODE_525_length_2637_cov_27.056881_g449_i0.p1  ORF type:complete len:615 (-),score=109.69 NODE_525_length_2637_cov_27.056881_g449_i0:166-2010(-)